MINVGLDTETNGMKLGMHEVIQIGVVVANNSFVATGDKFFANVRPMRPEISDPKAMEINGIDIDHLVKTAPTPMTVKSSLLNWKNEIYGEEERLVPIVHNSLFDIPRLQLMLGNIYNLVFDYHVQDTMFIARYLRDKGKIKPERLTLSCLCEYLDIVNERPHHAIGDASATLQVYKKLIEIK